MIQNIMVKNNRCSKALNIHKHVDFLRNIFQYCKMAVKFVIVLLRLGFAFR